MPCKVCHLKYINFFCFIPYLLPILCLVFLIPFPWWRNKLKLTSLLATLLLASAKSKWSLCTNNSQASQHTAKRWKDIQLDYIALLQPMGALPVLHRKLPCNYAVLTNRSLLFDSGMTVSVICYCSHSGFFSKENLCTAKPSNRPLSRCSHLRLVSWPSNNVTVLISISSASLHFLLPASLWLYVPVQERTKMAVPW